MDIRNVVPALVSLSLIGCATTKTADTNVFSLLEGAWGWEDYSKVSCEVNPHVISFSDDKEYMFLETRKPFFKKGPDGKPTSKVTYRIIETSPNLRMRIEGETRTTAAGVLVVWDLVVLSGDRYCWHRTDWSPGECTGGNERCDG